MKRIIVVLLALTLCVGARAQLYLGGGLGLGVRNGYLSLDISPDIGYRLGNNLVVGGQLSYRTGYEGLGIIPYARWHVTSQDKLLSVFLSANAPCTFRWDSQSYSFQLRPGASLRLAGNLYALMQIGYFGWSTVVTDGHAVSNGWEWRLDWDTIKIGFCICL